MVSRRIGTRKRQHSFSWGLLSFLGVYFLSLCAQCPLVSADPFPRQVVQAHHTSAEHCSHPSAAQQTAGPLAADHERTTVPVCCNLMGANKATIASSIQTAPAPLQVMIPLPQDSGFLAKEVQPLHLLQALHSSHPPPLYLLHASLLI